MKNECLRLIGTKPFMTTKPKDMSNNKCTNCKHCDEMKETMGHVLIHCSYFEEYMPIEIGKCDLWEGKE